MKEYNHSLATSTTDVGVEIECLPSMEESQSASASERH